MSNPKVSYFYNANGCSVLTLEDGSVRMLGEAGKSGAFGFYSKSRNTVSKITNEGVTVQCIKDKNFAPLPLNMGKIVQCITDGATSFAINDKGKLFVWGFVKAKDNKHLPFGEKIKRIVRIQWDQIVFVTDSNKNILFTRNSDKTENLLRHLSSIGGLLHGSSDSRMGFLLDESRTLTVFIEDRDEEERVHYTEHKINKCVWAFLAEAIYCKDEKGKVYRFTQENPKYYYGSHHIIEDMWKEKNPILFDAIDARENWHNPLYGFRHEGNTVYVVSTFNRGNDTIKSFTFDKEIKQFDPFMVMFNDGMIMPITENIWTRTDMILSAFPEWQDDEDTVYELCKVNPRNFLCASERLRNSVEFCKKIALIGQEAMKCVEGKVRRNRELRPIKKLYDMAAHG